MIQRALIPPGSWARLLIIGLLPVIILASCNMDQPEPEETVSQTATAERNLGSRPISSPVPGWVQSTVVSPTELPTKLNPTEVRTESAASPIPTLVPTPTPRRKVVVYIPERFGEDAVAAINSTQLIDGIWDWQFTDDPSSADVVMAEGSSAINAGERSIALIVPFTSSREELTLVEAEQYLSDPTGEITIADWEEIPNGFKALRVGGYLPNDEAYSPRQQWSLITQPEHEPPAIALGAALTEELSNLESVHLTSVGDIMLDRSLGYAIESGDLLYPFAQVADILSAADITVGNFESSLGDLGEQVAKSYNFQAPAEAAQSLAFAGFDVMSLANNHAMDFGAEALVQAIDLLERNGIYSVGAGVDNLAAHKPVVLEKFGIRVAFLAYVDVPVEVTGFDTRTWEAGINSPGVAWASPDTISEDVISAKSSAEVVVVLLHSGYEFQQEPSPQQITSARAAIDAGASLVISHHSHLLQGVEFYKDGVIFFGLSNFAFDMDGSPDSAILNVWLDQDGVRNIEFVPITIGQGGQPALATTGDSLRIREEIYRLTRLRNQP